MNKVLTVKDENGGVWAVPVDVIARSRATHYAHEFDGDVERSLAEDTLPLFAGDDYEIEDWAANNMNWSDVAAVAYLMPGATRIPNMQEAWVNGEKAVITITAPATAPQPENDDA